MAKEFSSFIKLQVPAGKANPSPPIGPALGQHGVNIMEFCKAFNAQTQGQDTIIPVVITVYKDRSFTFITKTPPVPVLIKKALKLNKGSSTPNTEKVGTLSIQQVEEIAKQKMPDLNCYNLDNAMKSVAGTARSMGILLQEADSDQNDVQKIEKTEPLEKLPSSNNDSIEKQETSSDQKNLSDGDSIEKQETISDQKNLSDEENTSSIVDSIEKKESVSDQKDVQKEES